ncbi:hypothetical protein KEM48_003636 [Puccinia striiformis f. sp. tritici PST-130]|nr:hypothetical protein KEM48_003636 [Puccinia striiformis f. sp. tritici PST-130]
MSSLQLYPHHLNDPTYLNDQISSDLWFLINLVLVKRAISNIFPLWPKYSLPDQHVSKRARYNDLVLPVTDNGKKPHIHPEQASKYQIIESKEYPLLHDTRSLKHLPLTHIRRSSRMNSSPDLTASTSQDSRPVSSENAVSNELDVGDYGEIEEMIVLDKKEEKGDRFKVVPLLNSFTLETTLKRSFNELNKFLVFINTCLLKTLNQKYIHGEMMIQANDDLQEWIFKIIFYPDYGKAIITEYKPTASINMDTDFLLEVRRNQNQNQNQIQSLIVGFLRDGPTQDFQKKFRDTITIIGIYYKQELPDLWKNSFENNDFSFWLILQRSIELAKIENLDLNQILTISASGGTIINSLSFLSNQPIQSKISQFTERIQGQIKKEFIILLRLVQLIRIKSDRKLIEPQIAIRKLEILLNSLHNLHTTLLTYLNKNNLEIFPNALDTFLEWFSRAIFDYTSEVYQYLDTVDT